MQKCSEGYPQPNQQKHRNEEMQFAFEFRQTALQFTCIRQNCRVGSFHKVSRSKSNHYSRFSDRGMLVSTQWNVAHSSLSSVRFSTDSMLRRN